MTISGVGTENQRIIHRHNGDGTPATRPGTGMSKEPARTGGGVANQTLTYSVWAESPALAVIPAGFSRWHAQRQLSQAGQDVVMPRAFVKGLVGYGRGSSQQDFRLTR